MRGLNLLTMKPLVYAANVEEGDLANQGASNTHVQALQHVATADGSSVIIVSAQVGTYGPAMDPVHFVEHPVLRIWACLTRSTNLCCTGGGRAVRSG